MNKAEPLRKFIYEDNYRAGFDLYIYKTRKQMLAGMNDWNKRHHFEKDTDTSYGAICVFPNKKTPKKIGIKSYTLFGTLFMNEADADGPIIAHESLHMALAYEKEIIKYDGNFEVEGSSIPEERIAERIQKYFRKIASFFEENNIHISLS